MKKKSIAVNALFNIIKTCASIIFPLITYPYVVRILEVKDMGNIEFSRSIINYVNLIAGLGIANYAIREGAKIRDNKVKFSNFANQMFSLNLIMTFVALLGLTMVYYFTPYLHSYGKILSIFSIITVGTTFVVDWINSIYEDFVYITIRNIIIQFIALVLMLTLIKNKNDYLVYVGILTFSSVGAAIPNWFYIKKYCKLKFTFHIEWKKHIKPIMMLFAISVATVIYVNVDSTMLNIMKGAYDNGLYSAAVKIYNIFKNVVAAIIIVTVPRLSALSGKEDAKESKRLMKLIFNVVLSMVLPLCLLSGLLSKEIIKFIAGEKYVLAAGALRILSLSLVFSSMASFMTTSVLLPNGKEKEILKASITSAVVNLLLNFVMIPKMSFIGASLTTMIAELVMFLVSYKAAKKYIDLSEMKKDIMKYVISCNGIVIVWFLISYYFNLNGIVYILTVGIIGMVIYGLVNLHLWDIDIKKIFSKCIVGRKNND
ncbi:flippase [Bariatricus sp. HCP3S3_E12]|uniref:flippase n=1 Tax=Bariatricus sp. HCP3S3_E12 TaxID=3438906 RepID=UPI003F8CB543